MKKAFKNRLVKALRSGKYKQGKFALHRKILDDYCCLGVACRVAKIEPIWHNKGEDSRPSFLGDKERLSLEAQKVTSFGSDVGYILLSVSELKWLKEKYINKINDELSTSLAVLNDAGVSFNDIATLIENHWEQL